jgi:SAM-dependent methyltransferase
MAELVLAIKRNTPWWAKLGAKLAASRVPVGYGAWRALGLTRFGGMARPTWAYQTFKRHLDAADFPRKGAGFSALELGPGDSLFTSLSAHAHGASEVTLIDVGTFAKTDLPAYQSMVDHLAGRGLPVARLQACETLDEMMSACGTRYLTDGLDSLKAVPTDSVDFAFSNAVLQEVRRPEVAVLLSELRRVLRPGGVASHSIGLWDQLGFALNNLRFSERFWEGPWVRRSGFYTNRIRFSEWDGLFTAAGFRAEYPEVNRWDRLPTPRARLAPVFRGLADEDLRVYSFNVVLRPA